MITSWYSNPSALIVRIRTYVKAPRRLCVLQAGEDLANILVHINVR